MTDLRSEYLAMMDVFARCVEAVCGKTVRGDSAFEADTQPLATKLFFHLGSVFHLQEGTSLPRIAEGPAHFIDFPSISILMRAAFETYLTFQFIFVQPTSVEERKFRHTVWVLGGLLDRQRFTTTTPEGKTKLQEEKAQIDGLRQSILSSPVYAQLPEPRRKEAKAGKWRLGKQWVDIAELFGTHREYFVSLYAYLSSYAHTNYLSVLQLSQAHEKDHQSSLAGIYTYVGMTLMSHFILVYCSLFQEAQRVLDEDQDSINLLKVYYVKAEDWEALIKRA